MTGVFGKKLVIFSGPPGSGKDTAANHVVRKLKEYNYVWPKKFSLADPAKEAVHRLFGLMYDPPYYDSYAGRDEKDSPHPLLLGHSPRDMYITFISMLQDAFGKDILGKIAMNNIHNRKFNVLLASSGGQPDEWTEIIKYLGPKNVILIELEATGKTYIGDSRASMLEFVKSTGAQAQIIPNTISTDPLDRELFLMLVWGVVSKFLGIEA